MTSSATNERVRPDLITLTISSFMGTGFFPFAPATFASAILTGLMWLAGGAGLGVRIALLVVSTGVGVWAATHTEKRHGHDARCIVIDEVAGMFLSVLFIPWDWPHLVVAFGLFRIMDILKPPPVYQMQSLPRGWGVMVDDLGAGAYTLILLFVAKLLIPAF